MGVETLDGMATDTQDILRHLIGTYGMLRSSKKKRKMYFMDSFPVWNCQLIIPDVIQVLT